MSPFACAVAFVKDNFSVSTVTIKSADGTSDPTTTVRKGGSVQYAAVVAGSGSYNGAVTWSLTGQQESGTYIMGGTLRIATNETATYLTLTATSVADSTKTGSITISVTGSGTVSSVTVDPSTKTVAPGGTQAFTATVAGSGDVSQAVAWSVTGANKAGTTISGSGVLTIDATETATSLTVTATSAQDSTVTGTATVTVDS